MDNTRKEKLLNLKKMNKEIFRDIMEASLKINNEISTLKKDAKANDSNLFDNPIFKIEEDKLIERYYSLIGLLFMMDNYIDYQLKEGDKDE